MGKYLANLCLRYVTFTLRGTANKCGFKANLRGSRSPEIVHCGVGECARRLLFCFGMAASEVHELVCVRSSESPSTARAASYVHLKRSRPSNLNINI